MRENDDLSSFSTHGAIIFGKKKRKLYSGYYVYESSRVVDLEKYEYYEDIEDTEIEIFRGEIRNPPLSGSVLLDYQSNESMYIHDRRRDLNGNYVYYTNYTVEVIEDELTQKSLEKFHKDREEIIRKALKEENETLGTRPEVVLDTDGIWNHKRWYHFWR